MLNQQMTEAEEAASSSRAADVRVGNEELVAAMAAIEARWNDPHVRDTIALGEAVQQLGLDMTPEQLLAEIQAKRAQSAAPVVRKRPRALPLLGAAFAISLAVTLLLVVRVARVQPPALAPMSVPLASAPPRTAYGMAGVLQAINASSFDEGKVATVRALAKTRYFWSSNDVRRVLAQFASDQGREDAAFTLYHSGVDRENFLPVVLTALSSDASRQDLINRLGLQ